MLPCHHALSRCKSLESIDDEFSNQNNETKGLLKFYKSQWHFSTVFTFLAIFEKSEWAFLLHSGLGKSYTSPKNLALVATERCLRHIRLVLDVGELFFFFRSTVPWNAYPRLHPVQSIQIEIINASWLLTHFFRRLDTFWEAEACSDFQYDTTWNSPKTFTT